ncbi:MAG: ribose-5-phosphate isomerase RpiA [Methanospirillum sp.]|nr:ribose-5-phosphate isomerase RpiA [Methanospirillum sp.]
MKNEDCSPVDNGKRSAGFAAAEYVTNGMVVGLGTGSTVAFAMERLAERISGGLSIQGVPTSIQTAIRARSLGIPLLSPDSFDRIDLTIDGADQIDPGLRLIKGRGAAHVRERIIADASSLLIVVADPSKLCDRLSGPVPIEIIPFALCHVIARLSRTGGRPVIREGVKKDGPVFSDNGNIVLDYHPLGIEDPLEMEMILNNIPGVVGCGIFAEYSEKTLVIVGETSGPRCIKL